MRLTYPTEPYPLGTAGLDEEEPFVVIQADNIMDMNLRRLIDFHHEAGGQVTIALTLVEDPWNYGIAVLEANGSISRFHEKPVKGKSFSNLASTGIYVIDPKAMEWMLKKARRDVFIGENVEINGSGITGPAVIGNSVVVEENCSVGPDVALFEDVYIGKNSSLDHCFIGERTMTGENACIKEAIIGAQCELGNDVDVLILKGIYGPLSLYHTAQPWEILNPKYEILKNPNDQNYKFKTNLSLEKKALPKKLLFLVKVFAKQKVCFGI